MKLKFLLFFLIPISIYSTGDKNVKNHPEKSAATGEIYVFDLQRMYIPIDNKGVIADVNPGDGAGGKFDGINFLFSSGFYNTGYSNDSMWSTGNLSASRIEDYQPGPVGSNPADPKNVIYSIKGTDEPFGDSWQEWIDAVSIGAKFYDGNSDGLYNPVDLNGNGIWDTDEDRPDFLGDYTAWCVINDGVDSSLRRYNTITPQGLEIRQTIFTSKGIEGQSEDLFIIRYELANMGTVADIFDSVYFATATDPDLGNYQDDLVACDTLAKSGFAYNDSADTEYGIDPPAFIIKQLQGPPIFVPGITFIDNNSDNEYTNGIDTPLDSAVFNRGEYLGIEYIAGARNLNPTSFINYYKSHPSHGDPDSHIELRNYLMGKDKFGNLIDPCTWTFGNGASLPNCGEINPRFMYSGDPVTGEGWLPNFPNDQRFSLSTGPFKLKVDEPVELIYAYIVGRGTDHLNSITKAIEISQFAQSVYDNNFEDLPTGIDDYENLIAKEFQLYQNYPNPFNPVTTIKYQIPSNVKGQMANVKIIVFDILGREIRTLVNEQKPAGTYEVKFDASKLSSGVYFYQLKFADFIQTKKLILLK